MQIPLQAASISIKGAVRDKNEDSCLISLESNLFIVSDGMGGHLAGDIASQSVITVLPRMLDQRMAARRRFSSLRIKRELKESISELSQLIQQQSVGQMGLSGMGATVALVLIREHPWKGLIAYLAHLGDSRIYLYQSDKLMRLTEDHTIVSLLVANGEISSEEARMHPARGQLSRYVGMDDQANPDVQTLKLTKGDRLLLCSDGLTSMISDVQISRLLKDTPDPAQSCSILADAANQAGGKDNITAIIINYGNTP
jgi:serine/threonine protein phosphatase PrpC